MIKPEYDDIQVQLHLDDPREDGPTILARVGAALLRNKGPDVAARFHVQAAQCGDWSAAISLAHRTVDVI